MSSVQLLSKRDVFRLDLKEKRLGASRRGLGGNQGHRSYVSESTLSILVEFDAWNSHETSVCRTQRAGRLIDREKTRQVGRTRRIAATIAQDGILYSIRGRTGNQWRDLSKGFAWSRPRLPRTRRAALCCTLCRRSGRLASKELK